jgi:hypothetical protein
MKNTIRSFVLASAFLATVAFTVKTAMAASAVNVPFAFTVDNQICPAGHYLVERDSRGSAIKLVGATQSFTWGIHPGDAAPTDSRVVLKFDDTGSGHALSEIQYGPLTTSRLDKKFVDSEARSTEVVLGR